MEGQEVTSLRGRTPNFNKMLNCADPPWNDDVWKDAYFSYVAWMAYRGKEFGAEMFEKELGYEEHKYLDHCGAQAHLIMRDDHSIIAFRGTEIKEARPPGPKRATVVPNGGEGDVKTAGEPGKREMSLRKRFKMKYNDCLADLKVIKKDANTKGQVHRGFYQELENLWRKEDPEASSDIPGIIQSWAADAKERGAMLYLVGHSLGGAMALLAATRLVHADLIEADKVEVHTFGSPRLGNSEWVRANKAIRHRRLQNCTDLIVYLPPLSFGYRHHGNHARIAADGYVRENPSLGFRIKDDFKEAVGMWSRGIPHHRAANHTVQLYSDKLMALWLVKATNEPGKNAALAHMLLQGGGATTRRATVSFIGEKHIEKEKLIEERDKVIKEKDRRIDELTTENNRLRDAILKSANQEELNKLLAELPEREEPYAEGRGAGGSERALAPVRE